MRNTAWSICSSHKTMVLLLRVKNDSININKLVTSEDGGMKTRVLTMSVKADVTSTRI